MRIAELLANISELELAKESYNKSEALITESEDYVFLAQLIIDNYDFSWGMNMLNIGINLINQKPNVWHYIIIANAYADSIGDYLNAREYYKIAEKYAIRPTHYEFLAEQVGIYLKDGNWCATLIEKSKQIQDFLTKN